MMLQPIPFFTFTSLLDLFCDFRVFAGIVEQSLVPSGHHLFVVQDDDVTQLPLMKEFPLTSWDRRSTVLLWCPLGT